MWIIFPKDTCWEALLTQNIGKGLEDTGAEGDRQKEMQPSARAHTWKLIKSSANS